MKRLRLLVEGRHDGPALANLVNRILQWNHAEVSGELFVDGEAVQAKGLPALSGRHEKQWHAKLRIAVAEKPGTAGVLAVFDGDDDSFEMAQFCPTAVARIMSSRATAVGAGVTFSLAVVILSREYESMLLAVADQLPGYDKSPLPTAPEISPRGAKEWLGDHIEGGYKEVADQLRLTQSVHDWSPARASMRCFRRLESAVAELAGAALTGTPCRTPAPPAEAVP